MRLAFVDDTKQTGKRAGLGELLGLGSICFADNHVKPFAEDFRAVLDRHSVPPDVEMKWSSDSRSDWFRHFGKQDEVTPIRRELLMCARDHGARVHFVVWDTTAAPDCEGVAPIDKARQFLFERITFMLATLDERALLLFDKPGGDQRTEDQWVRDAKDLTENGTEYVSADRIVGHHHPQVQLADLVVGAVTAAVGGSRYGLALMPLIRPLFHTNSRGTIGAAGLKLFPDSINNLHFWLNEETDLFFADGQTIEATRRMGTGKAARDRRVVWQYSAARERRDNRTLNLQIDRAQQVADGKRPIKKDRFVKFTGDKPGINQARIDQARIVIGLKGYVTNIPAGKLDGAGVVAAYHDLFQVEKSFRMAKTDLRARPIFHHKKDSIEAHLTIVFAALAIARDLQNRTGVSIRRIVRELRPLRDVTINALGHDLTAATPPGPAATEILDALNSRERRPAGH